MDHYGGFKNKWMPALLLAVLFVVYFGIQCRAHGFEVGEQKRVLFISSYSPSFKTFFQQVGGIKSVFENENVELDIEFMDSKRLYTDENIGNFYTSLKYKIENLKSYDAVIVGDDNALNFTVEHQQELFKGVPIVFMGVNNVENAIKASETPYITGAIEASSIWETIEIGSVFNDKAKNVVALTDNTNSGQGDLESYYREADKFESLNFTDLDLSKLDFNEFAKRLQDIDEDDIVLLLSVFTDKNGSSVSFDEGLQIVLDNCSQPVYHPYYQGLGDGAIGGKVISHNEQGKIAASIVKEVFAGRDISEIPYVDESPNKYIFDSDVMKEYGIDEKLVPEDSLLLNKEVSFFEQYFGYVMGVLLILLVQLTLIVFLEVNIKKRKKTERELIASREKLVESNGELAIMNNELTASIEEIRVQDEKLNVLIYSDILTGLNNRLSIFKIIDKAVEYEKGNDITAIMFLDMDNFKDINDTYGHDAGDKVLKAIGEKLKKYQSDKISIGRFGGDEFLVVVKNQKDTRDIIELVEKIQDVFAEEIFIDNNMLLVTVSIGISIFPHNGKSRADLVKKADLALYKAKDAGRNTYVFYEDVMNESLEEKMILQSAIKKAVKANEFFLNYQPCVDANTHKVVGFEALIRWISSEHGYVSPYKLITNAEEIGLIVEIGEWVLREACIFARKINESRKDKLKISVNISALHLMHNEFYQRTMKIVEETGVSPELICLEMTETILMESIEKGITVIEKLKEQGFGIALDDFGTGYSSLSYFKELPVTVLKIDKSFIDNITSSIYEQKLIGAITNIAHYRDVEVVAEGVEESGQLEILQKCGCDTIQGYLFSRPLSESDTVEFMKNME